MKSKNDKQKFTKKELKEMAKKRSRRGLVRNKRNKSGIEYFENIVDVRVGGGIGVFLFSILFGMIGARYPLKLVPKNKTWNLIINFIIHFFLWYIIIPIRGIVFLLNK